MLTRYSRSKSAINLPVCTTPTPSGSPPPNIGHPSLALSSVIACSNAHDNSRDDGKKHGRGGGSSTALRTQSVVNPHEQRFAGRRRMARAAAVCGARGRAGVRARRAARELRRAGGECMAVSLGGSEIRWRRLQYAQLLRRREALMSEFGLS